MKWKSISVATSMLFGIGLVLSPVTSIHADGIPYLTAGQSGALMLDLRTDFSLPCKLIAEEHFLYDSIFTRI
ncbi:hypothetical protein ABZM74_000859 [Weissella confusa]|nr:hypothetical protein C6P12_07185 [Weissella confusa]